MGMWRREKVSMNQCLIFPKLLILFVLITLGVVIFIVRLQKTPAPVVVESQPDLTLQNGRQCYTYNHQATNDAPYTVNEFIDMNIDNGSVSGTKKGTQAGPDMTNGYSGTLVGTTDSKTMQVIFSYTVEGSKNKEKELYRTNKTGIEKLRYPLIEEKGMLLPDTTKDFQVLNYARVGCTASN